MNHEGKRKIFSGMQVLLGQQWIHDQAVVVEGTTIQAIIPAVMVKHHLPAIHYTFPADFYLIPGLIDLHIHGAGGKDVMDAEPLALITISKMLAEEGVTGFLATTMTSSNEQIEAALHTVRHSKDDELAAAVLGVHLEGPFISVDKRGAQSDRHVKAPDPALIKHWQTMADGAIKMVTLAPELTNAESLIKTLREANVIAACGHTNATYAETMAAIDAGVRYATHLFNAMRGLQQREPGATGALLLAKEVMAELIVDGCHLHPAMIELAYRLKGRDRLVLVSDAMRAKCCGDGEYDLGGDAVFVKTGRAARQDGTLAGSVLRLPDAIKNIVQYSSCTLMDAVQMASFNPARLLSLDRRKGSIEIGKDADLVILNAALEVQLTMREGRKIY